MCQSHSTLLSGWGDSFGTSGSELWAFQRVKKKKSCLDLIWETYLNLFPTKSPCIVFFSMSNLTVKITCDICKSADFLDHFSEILSRERDLGICIFNTKILFISCYYVRILDHGDHNFLLCQISWDPFRVHVFIVIRPTPVKEFDSLLYIKCVGTDCTYSNKWSQLWKNWFG